MAYVPVPKDLTKNRNQGHVQSDPKAVVCFTAGALVGVRLFFLAP